MEALSLLILLLPLSVSAYSWRFTTAPAQCQNLTVEISGGTAPYNVIILPFGPTPFPDTIATRRTISLNSTGNDNKLTWQANYPATAQLVAVVSYSSDRISGTRSHFLASGQRRLWIRVGRYQRCDTSSARKR